MQKMEFHRRPEPGLRNSTQFTGLVLGEFMSDCRRWILGAATALSAVISQGAAAQSHYYLGLEMGREHLSFKPEYSFVSGAPSITYDNQADGSVASVVGGYHSKSTESFSLDVQARLSVNNAAWRLTLPEPASLRYDLPLNVAVSLLPSFHFTERFTLFAEAGLALGRIREQKLAVTTSMYDIEKWRPGLVAGLGMSLALDERWSMRLGYRRTWYKNNGFGTYLVSGTQVEAVTSRVVQDATTFGLVRDF